MKYIRGKGAKGFSFAPFLSYVFHCVKQIGNKA